MSLSLLLTVRYKQFSQLQVFEAWGEFLEEVIDSWAQRGEKTSTLRLKSKPNTFTEKAPSFDWSLERTLDNSTQST